MTAQQTPRKVLRIITRVNIGGPSIHVSLLTAGLNNSQFTSMLVHGRLSPDEGDMSYYIDKHKVKPLYIPQLQREVHLGRDLAAMFRLLLVMWRFKPQIIHTHTAKAGFLGRLAAMIYRNTNRLASGSKNKPIRIVHTFHGHVFEGYFGSWRTYLFLAIERWLGQHTDRIVAISQTVKKEICEKHRIVSPNLVDVIRLGFEFPVCVESDYKSQLCATLGFPSTCYIVGIIGRLTAIKNHRMFLSAAKRITEAYSEDVRFIVVGDGELRSKLETEVQESILKDRLVFTGWKRDTEILFGGLDVVALTSHNEGTPVALIESLAVGTPVVATRVGGVPDVVEDSITGYLVEANDDGAMAERIASLINDQELRERFGREGQKRVRELYDCSRLIRDVSDLYDRLL